MEMELPSRFHQELHKIPFFFGKLSFAEAVKIMLSEPVGKVMMIEEDPCCHGDTVKKEETELMESLGPCRFSFQYGKFGESILSSKFSAPRYSSKHIVRKSPFSLQTLSMAVLKDMIESNQKIALLIEKSVPSCLRKPLLQSKANTLYKTLQRGVSGIDYSDIEDDCSYVHSSDYFLSDSDFDSDAEHYFDEKSRFYGGDPDDL